MKPPFTYFGGKIRLAPKIAATFPRHGHYVEPFAGSLAVLMAKPKSKMETVNDLDQDIMTFWRVLRESPMELAQACALTPHSRAEHAASYDLDSAESDLERARRIWVRLTQGRAGQMKKAGWRYYVAPAGSTASMPRYLEGYVNRMVEASARLHDVSLECRPAMELIDRYGKAEEALLYVDPPYLGATRSSGGYRFEMKDEESHAELASALRRCRGAVVLSGYDSDLYAGLYEGWHLMRIDTKTGQGGARQERTEVLWSNRDLFAEAAA